MKKCPKNGENSGFFGFLKNGLKEFFYFLTEDRSNSSLPYDKNCMSVKNLCIKIFGPKSWVGWVFSLKGPLFTQEYLGNEKSYLKSDWIFIKIKVGTCRIPPVKIRKPQLLPPEKLGPDIRSVQFLNLVKNHKFCYCSKTAPTLFHFAC